MLKFSIKNLIENNVSNNVSNSGSTAFNLNNILNLNEVKDTKADLPNLKSNFQSESFIADSQNLLMNFNEYQKFVLSKFQSTYATHNYHNSFLNIQNNNCIQQNINRLWLYRLSQRYFASNFENSQFLPNLVYGNANTMDQGSANSSMTLNLSSSNENSCSQKLADDKIKRKRNNSDTETNDTLLKKLRPSETELVLPKEKSPKQILDELNNQKNQRPKTFPCSECGKVNKNCY